MQTSTLLQPFNFKILQDTSSNVKPNQACYVQDDKISTTDGIMASLMLRDKIMIISVENVTEIGVADNLENLCDKCDEPEIAEESEQVEIPSKIKLMN